MTTHALNFALNHMSCPALTPFELIDLAAELGVAAVELRNDVKQNSIADLDDAKKIGEYAREKRVRIITINALYPFNIWNDERAAQAEKLAQLAVASGTEALVCCPLVDASYKGDAKQRAEDLKNALIPLNAILARHNLKGLVEPLGFPISSLRYKSEVINVIDQLGLSERFSLVHDTFHHAGARETTFYPGRTGLIHASSVTDPAVNSDTMLDGHRLFVTDNDALETVAQIKQLLDDGYQGYISFEPFYEGVWELADPKATIGACMTYLEQQLTD